MYRATVSLLLILLALAAAAPADAAPATWSGSAAMPVQATGDAAVSASESSLLLEGSTGTVAMSLEGDATITRVLYRSFGYVRPEDPAMEVLWGNDVERHEVELGGGRLVLTDVVDGFQLFAFDGSTHLETTTAVVGQTTELHAIEYEPQTNGIMLRTGKATVPPFHHEVDAGLLAAQSATGTAGAAGRFGLFVSSAQLKLERDGVVETIRAHTRTEERPGSIYDPVSNQWIGPASHTEHIQEYLEIDARDARLAIAHQAVPVRIYTEDLVLAVTGEARLPDARGTVHVETEEGPDHHDLHGDDATLGGTFRLDLAADGDRARFTGTGDVTHLSYGATTSQYDWTRVAQVTIGAAVLAGLAWVAKSLLGVAGYARVQGSRVLEHSGRQEVYDLVKQNPGIGFSQLVGKVCFGESTLQYHLRVLERNEFVTRVKDGRYQRFFDRQSGLYSASRKVAVSALRNGTTARIAGVILQEPGIAQRDLADRFGIAASTVNWHIQRLHRAGLVDPRRDHPHTRYYAGGAWSTIPHEEHARLVAA